MTAPFHHENRGPAPKVPSPVATTRSVIVALTCTSVLLQVFIDPSQTNLATAVIAGVSSILTALYVFRRGVMTVTPISSLIVFGLGFTLLLGPLTFQTLDWRPIAFNLDAPVAAVGTAAFASLLACLTHAIYRALPPCGIASQALARTVHTALFVFRTPTNVQLWLMGFIGIAATWTTGTADAGQAVEYGDVGGKLLQAFSPFILAPAFIVIAPYLFPSRAAKPPNWIQLLAYFGLVLVLAFARNSRGGFAVILFVLILCLATAVWTGRLKPDRRAALGGLAAIVIGLPALSFLSDVSTAMLIHRSARNEVSATELIERTLETAGDPIALKNYRAKASIIDNRYNEIYIASDFLGRLTLLKFLDLNIRHTQGITESQKDYARHIFVQRLLANLPTPVLTRIGLDVDKSTLKFSGGDVYRFIASRGEKGAYVTGSALADGLAIMGLLFWPFLMVLALVSFVINDAFVRYGSGWGLFISPAILFQVDKLFMFGLNGDNLANVIGGLLRGYPQSLLLYAGLFLVTGMMSGVSTRSDRFRIPTRTPHRPGQAR